MAVSETTADQLSIFAKGHLGISETYIHAIVVVIRLTGNLKILEILGHLKTLEIFRL